MKHGLKRLEECKNRHFRETQLDVFCKCKKVPVQRENCLACQKQKTII
jgi:hypothetical protein